jgi:hypothetical protein
MTRGPAPTILAASLFLATHAGASLGQAQPGRFAEYRMDAILGDGSTGQIGATAQLPLGYYVRLGLTGAAGLTRRGGMTATSGRLDVIARYLLDPYREVRWALSLGGGLSLPYVDGGRRVRPYATLVADLEGPRRGPFSPALQVGLGGGARIGLMLRSSKGPWR